ncbi:MAG: alpha-1,2-fucosyltransferase, partial [Verrucomicrobiota bacterium]
KKDVQPRRPSRMYIALERDMAAEGPVACLHVRRGDYLNSPDWGLLTPEYYLAALESAGVVTAESQVWVFSDDPVGVGRAFPTRQFPTFRVVSELQMRPAAETLCLMQKFALKIIANSSLSWWAAILGEGRVIAPAPWYRTTDFANDRIPPDWTTREAVWDQGGN